MLDRFYYGNSISGFLSHSNEHILGQLVKKNTFTLELDSTNAWQSTIAILKRELRFLSGDVYLEFSIPRMGRRADAVVVVRGIVFVLEFKVNESIYVEDAKRQVWDYALDLKNFHETSHSILIVPILVATNAPYRSTRTHAIDSDGVLRPLCINAQQIGSTIASIVDVEDTCDPGATGWVEGGYRPTPSIVEAARALYAGHSVIEISRSEGGSENISRTSAAIDRIIEDARSRSEKCLVLVTGVPGAGKTLVGLDVATRHSDPKKESYSVFLSGNGPLVSVLTNALANDLTARQKVAGERCAKSSNLSKVKAFIQIVHEFRDECLRDERPPIEHVALFDEAQRAWTLEQTASFMKRKKGVGDFSLSEPEFLISCLDRHKDWAVIVALIGGGQEINRGEAGVLEWLRARERSFPDWRLFISDRLQDSEYGEQGEITRYSSDPSSTTLGELHLAVSMRSFRAENVSHLVKALLDGEREAAEQNLSAIKGKYPLVLTRDLRTAKSWLRSQARGSERYGIMVSSSAERLRPHAIHVKAPVDPVHWFLGGPDDVRSSYYCEDVVTEFQVQGLELDWSCVVWDADFRRVGGGWQHWDFQGSTWRRKHQDIAKQYQKNAYRVLLTRARQGMVICVPHGDPEDPTRLPEYYDGVYGYLEGLGIEVLAA